MEREERQFRVVAHDEAGDIVFFCLFFFPEGRMESLMSHPWKQSQSGFSELLTLLSGLEFLEENWPGFHMFLSSKEIIS